MIETITVLFRSRADCSDWADKITAQIRAARQSAVMPSKLSVQPLPPPHVSVSPGPGVSPHYVYGHSPPYVALTAWIRENLAQKKLTFNHIKSLQRPPRVISDSSASCQGRSHKVECVIYPSSSQLDIISDSQGHGLLDKAPVVLKDPQITESNPFGYIHYIPSISDNSSEKDFLKSNIDKENEDLITLVHSDSRNKDSDSVSRNKDTVSYFAEDMAFLLPRSLLNSSTDSHSRTISRNDTIHSMGVSNETDESYNPGLDIGPWGKKLPATNQFEDDPSSTEPRFRIASEGCYDQRQKTSTKSQIVQSLSAPVLNKEPGSRPRRVKVQCKHQRDFQREESPPDWLSCFASPKTRKKHFRRPEDVYSKSSTRSVSSSHKSQSPPIKYIDKTPSENSLNLPYCPPVKLDYEQFSQLDYLSSSNSQRKISAASSPRSEIRGQSRSGSRSRGRVSELAVIPVSDQAELFTIPDTPASPRPVRKHRSQVVAQIGVYPSPVTSPAGQRRCVCDSRRSSDSGLADMTRHHNGCPQGSQVSGLQTPLSPTLSRQSRLNSAQTSPSQARRGVTRDMMTRDSVYTCPSVNTSLASGYSTQTCNSTDFTLNQPRSHRLHESKSEKNLSERPQLDTQMSVSLEDVKICDEEKKTENAFTDGPSPVVKSPQWSRTKEIYTTGLYAHWWLNASLQPISEENLSDKLTENL